MHRGEKAKVMLRLVMDGTQQGIPRVLGLSRPACCASAEQPWRWCGLLGDKSFFYQKQHMLIGHLIFRLAASKYVVVATVTSRALF